MARRDKSNVSAAVMPDPDYTDDPEYDPANADDNDPRNFPASTSTSGQRPRLTWNAAMDDALVSATRTTTNGAELVSLLQRHDAFADLPASVITQGKIGNRLSKLRKAGVDVPKLKAPGGYFGPKYTPDVDRLNRLLRESSEPSEAGPVPAE